ncbi:MAG: hypothetical protein OXC79_08880 [Candidatus Poribacteria bacterium]|nr:hypothetical protein [Candidatus Poribacteria bacterium]
MNLSDILYDYAEFDWDDYLDELEVAVLDYNDANARGDEDPAIHLRAESRLCVYWQSVRALNIHQWVTVNSDHLPSSSGYDVGIFLVGFSSLPIVLSIAEIQPQKIYFIHSEDTERKCDEITNRLTEMLEVPPNPFSPLIDRSDAESLIDRVRGAKRRLIADASNPVSTFRELKNIIDEEREGSQDRVKIALDLTGGKKTMIGGGFTAGSIYSISPKCDMFYVDSQEYKPDRGTPKPGTEFLNRLDNPYDIYNVQSVTQAKELFKQHNYEAAERLWRSVRNKLYRPATQYDFLVNEREEARKYYGSSHCYYPWDAFDYQRAKERKTYDANGQIYSWGYDEQHVRCTIDVLDILAQVTNKSTLFDNECTVIHYAVDRYQNGMRRRQSRRLADAIVRFAQVIEIICNYRIYRLAQDNNFVNIVSRHPIGLPANKIWEFGHLIKLLFGDRDGGRVDIGHATCHVLPEHRMQAGDYDCADADRILGVIQPRNDFIHFNSSMRQEQAETDTENLRDLAYKFLKKFIGDYCGDYCSENNLSLNDLLELHKFRRWEEK